jgi:hypothetical protein
MHNKVNLTGMLCNALWWYGRLISTITPGVLQASSWCPTSAVVPSRELHNGVPVCCVQTFKICTGTPRAERSPWPCSLSNTHIAVPHLTYELFGHRTIARVWFWQCDSDSKIRILSPLRCIDGLLPTCYLVSFFVWPHNVPFVSCHD